MTIARKLIYAASNGDNWFLCVGKNPTDVFVLHEPNGPSGGRPSRVELSTFLSSGRTARSGSRCSRNWLTRRRLVSAR